METFLILGMILLLVLIILPFWFLAPRASRDSRLVQDVFGPERYRYTLSLPENYSEDEKFSLVVILHYGGHGAPYFGKMILVDFVEPALRELNAIFVAPDCPTRNWVQPKSVQLVLDLLEEIQEKYNVDPDRVLVTGYSLGGVGTWNLAGEYPDRFSAAIVMAGFPPDDVLEMDWQIPLYVIQGRNDELFPVAETTKIVAQLEEKGVDISYRILERVTHYETHKYVPILRDVVPWIKTAWEKKN